MKVKTKLALLRCQTFLWEVAASPGFSFCERYVEEHSRYDPKDGELCLPRVKPGEILVEA